MSELIQQTKMQSTAKWQLLASVSAFALIANAALPDAVSARDDDHPTVWIELGGQLQRLDGGEERFAPPFALLVDTSAFTSPVDVQRPPRHTIGGDAKLSITPGEDGWVFSAAIRYGRANRNRAVHQEQNFESGERIVSIPAYGKHYDTPYRAFAKRYSDTAFTSQETHAVVDFSAGKDVGLGLFGREGTSIVNAGIRFAQFQSRTSTSIGGDPDFAFSYKYATNLYGVIFGYFKIPKQHWHLFSASADIDRSFRGIGPSLSWDQSIPVLGNEERLQVALDFGVNGALLFGRQKTKGHHETRADYRPTAPVSSHNRTILTPVYHHVYDVDRSRSVIVPNLGGFAGLSFNYSNARIKFGYRADFFFGALDGGIDTRKSYDRNFYGPFATISIGLGGASE